MNKETALKITVRKKDFLNHTALFLAPEHIADLDNGLLSLHYNAADHDPEDYYFDGFLRQNRIPYDKEWFGRNFVSGAQSCRVMDDGSLKMETVIKGCLCNVALREYFPIHTSGELAEFPIDDGSQLPLMNWTEQDGIIEAREKAAAYLHTLSEEDLDDEVYDMCFRLGTARVRSVEDVENDATNINNAGKDAQVTFLVNSLYRIQ